MKLKKVLTTSMLCALVCTALPVANSYADEMEKVEVKIHSTSIEEINNSISNKSENFVTAPSVLGLQKLSNRNDIYSLVTEEDTIMPELEENSFYIKEDVELKPVLAETETPIAKIEKGAVVKVEMSGDKKATVSVDGKVGVIDVSVLTKEKVEPEKKETEVKPEEKKEKEKAETPKVEEKKAEEPKQAPVKKVSLYATETLNVRAEQSATSNKLGLLSKGEKVNGIDRGDWVEFEFNGQTAYVIKSYLSETKPVVEQPKVEEKAETPKVEENKTPAPKQENKSYSADIETVVDIALAQVGKPYVWASANPNVGFDCSGLVYYAYKQVGINLSRTSYTQINDGTRISASELRKGDLVFFNNGGDSVGHVGIYIGNNQFVHASSPGTGVIVSNLFGSYFGNTFCGATRIIK